MLKPVFHLCDLFSSSISSGINYIYKNGDGSCNVKVIFFNQFVFWGVFLVCHPPRQCYSPSSSCLNTILYCNVAFRPVTEPLFYLKILRGFVEWFVGSVAGVWIRTSRCSSWLHARTRQKLLNSIDCNLTFGSYIGSHVQH